MHGFGHAPTFRETAQKEGAQFIAVEDPKLIEERKGLSLAYLVRIRYLLPRFRLAQ